MVDNKYLALGGLAALILLVKPASAQDCEDGNVKCEGHDLYTCIDGEWSLTEVNSESCGYVPPICTNGHTKCVGYDLYTCINNNWILTDGNSPSCGYTPVCTNGQHKCIGPDEYVCINNQWILYDAGSPACTTPIVSGEVTDVDAPIEAYTGASSDVIVYWQNTGTVDVSGEIRFTIKDKYGSSVGTATSPSATVAPGKTTDELFDVTFNGEGPWSLECQLYGE